MHALGFAHEQTRGDRDDFVNVHTQNVKPGFAGIFRKIPSRFWIDTGKKKSRKMANENE